ncbi:MAG TPA: phosphatidylglycerol lysyltransferase domain-containing protein, partial [Acidimicrobiales bacterium]|nr:phosphatidylglycerol lysyltransferase domain-containing protein [Acidimicrobiales bacterium]
NDAPRGLARELVTGGFAGLVTGHTRHPELTHLGPGFYANAGCASEVVSETPSRLVNVGMPSLFLAHRQVSWVELEAGNELHVRLLHARQDLPGATLIERLMAQRDPETDTAKRKELHPRVAATFPQGASWPSPVDTTVQLRRIRRRAATLVGIAGIVSLVSAFIQPVERRLQVLLKLIPLVVPETADALVALAAVGLLVLARGVRRGQRHAWLICEGLLVDSAVLHLLRGVGVEQAAIALAIAAYLFVNRSAFQAPMDRPSARRGILTLMSGVAAAIMSGTVGVEIGTLLSYGRNHQRLPLPVAFEAAAERLLGIRHVVLPDRLDDFFAPAMLSVAIALGLAFAWLFFRPVVSRRALGTGTSGDTDLTRARGVVRRHGAGTLDYFAVRSDKQFFFWGDSMVAYGVYGGVCLVSPDPIGPEAERDETWKAFRRFVDEHGWTLAVLGAGEEWLPVYRASGMHDLYMGDEGVVDCTRFTLEGGRHKGLRQAVNRIGRNGYTISFHDPAQLDPTLRQQLEAVMTKSRRGDVERGFSMTLGRAFDPEDEGLLLAVVHGPDGDAVAFCQYVPAPGIQGYSLDLMRRDDGEHPNGLMDFAIVETIKYLRAHDNQGLGLNFAAMRAVLAGEAGEGLSQRVQAWLLRRMSDSMQIESLWKFNAKYDPRWQPRYALYDSAEHALPAVIAVARAESFWELPLVGRFLVPSVKGGPRVGESNADTNGKGDGARSCPDPRVGVATVSATSSDAGTGRAAPAGP